MYERLYVHNTDLEEKLLAIADGPMDQSIAFTGSTGSGKSTTIRYLFGDNRNPTIKDGKQIVIPFFIDGIRTEIADIEEIIVSQILVASDIIIEEHEVSITDGDLVKFIAQNKKSLIRGRMFPRNATDTQIIDRLEEKKPYAFAAERLKYACEKSTKIDRVLLIVDDVESAPYDKQQAIIKAILSFKSCLNNTRNETRTFKTAFIFSCRPATYEILRRDNQVNGFPQRKPIALKSPVALDDVIKKRFQFAIDAIGEGRIGRIDPTLKETKDIEKWREAFEKLSSVMGDITSHFGYFILEICNNNIRQAMVEIQNLLDHSWWFERDSHESGAFSVIENEYRTTHVGIFRAMILQNATCYSYQSDSVLVNPFFNFEHGDGDLIGCHIFKYFFQQAKSHRVLMIDEKRLKQKLEICYAENVVDDYYQNVIEYFESEEAVRFEVHSGGRAIVPQCKVFALYKSLSETGVFLEFFRDATFLNRDGVYRYSMTPYNGTSHMSSDNQFLALFDFVEQIIEAERDVYERVRRRGLVQEYDKNFGPQLISKRVLDGVTKNVHLYYKTGRRIGKLPSRVSKRILELHAYLKASRLLR